MQLSGMQLTGFDCIPKSNSFKIIPFHFETLVHSLFPGFNNSWKAFSGIFLSSVIAAILMELMSEKWVLFRTDLILGKRKKSHRARSREYGGGIPKLQCSFLQKTDQYSRLCDQER